MLEPVELSADDIEHPGLLPTVEPQLVTPGPEEDSSVLVVFEISTGRTQRHELDPAFPIEDAVALDADHVVVVGGVR